MRCNKKLPERVDVPNYALIIRIVHCSITRRLPFTKHKELAMYQTPEQLIAMNKANVEAALRFASVALNGADA